MYRFSGGKPGAFVAFISLYQYTAEFASCKSRSQNRKRSRGFAGPLPNLYTIPIFGHDLYTIPIFVHDINIMDKGTAIRPERASPLPVGDTVAAAMISYGYFYQVNSEYDPAIIAEVNTVEALGISAKTQAGLNNVSAAIKKAGRWVADRKCR